MAACLRNSRCLSQKEVQLAFIQSVRPQGLRQGLSSTLICRHGLHTRNLSRLLQYKSRLSLSPVVCHGHIPQVCSVLAARCNSSSTESLGGGYIPPPPEVEVILKPDVTEAVNALGEPTLASMGLGHWTPPGFVQHTLEALHISLDLPWWASIAVGAVIFRMCMFPVTIISQRTIANVTNHMPQVQKMQERVTNARLQNNQFEAARQTQEMVSYIKKHDIKYGRLMMMPMVQAPIFMSVFFGLRKMCNVPVESFKTGGMMWFTDLTIPDPTYLLPLVTCSTLLLTLEVGADGVATSTMQNRMRWVMRAMPVIMFPFLSNFPAAMLCYWLTSNSFSLVQVLFLKIPAVRAFFKIPEKIKHQVGTPAPSGPKRSFVHSIKDSWRNAKVTQELDQRQKLDAMRFEKAGKGPVIKTYATNPKLAKKKSR